MDLSRIAIEPRLRSGWEAVDMGVAMVRTWWWPLQLSWLLPSALMFTVLLFIFSETTWLAFLITWWLNPLWDRFPLMIVSRTLFDESPRVKSVWRQWCILFKTDWFAWLTWRRFSPTRALDMPVTVLEQLRGEVRGRRLTVLHHNTSGVAFLCTILCLLFVFVVIIALWVLVLLLLPTEFWYDQLMEGFNEFFWLSRWSVVVWYVALAMVAPFYVVTGFALYINRRIELEGWDIEIRFRHLAQRAQQSKTSLLNSKKIAAWLLPLLMCANLSYSPPSLSQDDGAQMLNADKATAKQTVIDVLSGDDFRSTEIKKGWRFKKDAADEAENNEGTWRDFFANIVAAIEPILSGILNVLKVVPILVWLLVAALIAFGIYYFRDTLATLGRVRMRPKAEQAPQVLFGLDLRQDSLPADVPAEVARLWQQEKHRDAVSLLYRATLSGLVHQFAFDFYDGYTEQECATLVHSRQDNAMSAYVQRLTAVWQRIAYAHKIPPDDSVSQLCEEWPNYFAGEGSRER